MMENILHKGPFKYYVILLGGRGGSPKDHKRSQGGRGGPSKDHVGSQGEGWSWETTNAL